MSAPVVPPTAMIVLASEQLWPNIHGLVHWLTRLRHLFICHTDDAKFSARPAQRLAALCGRLYPDIEVHLPDQPVSMLPDAVHAQLTAWIQGLPGQTWLINASGGTKPMYTGALRLVGIPGVTAVYRERAGEWYVLRPGLQGVEYERIDVPAQDTDTVSVKDLVLAQWEEPGVDIQFGPDPQPLPLRELTRALVTTGWDWPAAFRQIGRPSGKKAGLLFEDYVAAGLLELGVRNLACNVVHSAPPTNWQEIDLVANHGGSLVIIDCKLRSEEDEEAGDAEAITSQIRQAAETRRDLGGLAASLLLLRPNRPFSTELRLLAKNCNLHVVDSSDARFLFSRLASFLKVRTLPAPLQEAEAILQAAQRVFSRDRPEVAALVALSRSRAVVELDQYMREHGQDWIAYRLGEQLHVRCSNPGKLLLTELQRRLDALFRAFADVLDLAHSNSRATCWFRLKIRPGQREPLTAFLEGNLGQSLLELAAGS
jgi:Holliday junction resolvase-like predicted endonuclease